MDCLYYVLSQQLRYKYFITLYALHVFTRHEAVKKQQQTLRIKINHYISKQKHSTTYEDNNDKNTVTMYVAC